MDRKELERIIVGPIATVPTPFDDDYEVDYGRMSELTKGWETSISWSPAGSRSRRG